MDAELKIVGNSNFQRAANTSLILNYLRRKTSTNRKEISDALGLRPSTVTYITERFIRGGIVRFSSENPQSGALRSGRKPVQIEMNPSYGQVIGIDLQADYYHAVICDVRGGTIRECRRELPVDLESIDSRLLSAASGIEDCLEPGLPILGMGVALPGIVDARRRIVKDCWTHKVKDYPMASFLDSSFPFPVLVENDANCCARHIQWSRERREADSFLYLLTKFHDRRHLPAEIPAIGVGLGMILDDRLYSGHGHEAGEYQSIRYPGKGDVHWQLSLENQKIDRAATDRDVQREITSEIIGNMLFLMRILNPRALYVGGEMGRCGELIDECLNGEFRSSWDHLKAQDCEIVVLDDSDSHPAGGAAATLLETLYTIPQVGKAEKNPKLWNGLLANLFNEKP